MNCSSAIVRFKFRFQVKDSPRQDSTRNPQRCRINCGVRGLRLINAAKVRFFSLLSYQRDASFHFSLVSVHAGALEVPVVRGARALFAVECAVPAGRRLAGLEHFFAPAVIHCEITLHEDVASYVQHIVDAVAIGGEAVRNEDEGFAAGDGLYRDGHGVGLGHIIILLVFILRKKILPMH